jgi:hypothetical protein
MFFKRFSVLALLLLTLFAHLLFGQDSNSSLLVICFGENGHVALETVSTEANSPGTSPHGDCAEGQDCHDIVLALEHGERILLPQPASFEQSLAWSTRVLNTYIEPYFSPDSPALQATVARLPHTPFTDPPAFGAQPTAQIETLSHTILLI